MVTVYSSPTCQPCRLTKKFLDSNGIEYVSVDISVDEAAREYLEKNYKSQSLPVVDDGKGLVFCGLNPEMLKKLKQSEEESKKVVSVG